MCKKIFIYSSIFLISLGCAGSKGFTPRKILCRHPYEPKYDTNLSSTTTLKNVHSILQQEFTYIGSGNHCYVFASADQNYVIKFFKQNHMKAYDWKDFLPLPDCFLHKKIAERKKRKRLRDKTYQSYDLAYKTLPEETGIIFANLSCSEEFNQQITLIDQHKKQWKIKLSKAPFILQKKAIVGLSYLEELFQENRAEEAFELMNSLFQIIVKRCEQGLFDRDMQLFKNFGFLKEQAMEIDVGEFYFSSKELHPKVDMEIKHVSWQLENWLEKHFPEHLNSYHKMVDLTLHKLENDFSCK